MLAVIKNNVPRGILSTYLDQELPAEITTEYLDSVLSEREIIKLADNYFASAPRKSIYLFKIRNPFFSNIDEIPNMEKISNVAFKKLKIKRVTVNPLVRTVYLNKTLNLIGIKLVARSEKTISVVNPQSFEPEKRYKLIIGNVIIRANSQFIEIRGSELTQGLALRMLGKSLSFLGYTNIPWNSIKFVSFSNNLKFIRNLLTPDHIYRLGYVTLEFSGPNTPGKIVYSAKKEGDKYAPDDLRRIKEVQEKIEEAFKSGHITRVHGEMRLDPPLFYDSKISFAINFRESRIMPFGIYSEKALYYLTKDIYEVWSGVQNEARSPPNKDHRFLI